LIMTREPVGALFAVETVHPRGVNCSAANASMRVAQRVNQVKGHTRFSAENYPTFGQERRCEWHSANLLNVQKLLLAASPVLVLRMNKRAGFQLIKYTKECPMQISWMFWLGPANANTCFFHPLHADTCQIRIISLRNILW